MSAGLRVAGEVFWGTNGAIEALLEALAQQASVLFGDDDPTAAFFRNERDAFLTGAITDLDPVLSELDSRQRFLRALRRATEQLLSTGAFTEYGVSWLNTFAGALSRRVSDLG